MLDLPHVSKSVGCGGWEGVVLDCVSLGLFDFNAKCQNRRLSATKLPQKLTANNRLGLALRPTLTAPPMVCSYIEADPDTQPKTNSEEN